MKNREYDGLLKIVIVGDSAVGKSSLLLRFADGQFNQNYITTIGVDFRFKTIDIDGKLVKLQIWDTAGQQKFRTITNTYYKNANAVILVFDLTNKQTLNDIASYWINQVQSYADTDTHLILIGNKSDITTQRVITKEQAVQFAKQRKLDFYQMSAKTGVNVLDSFTQITKKVYQKSKNIVKQKSKQLKYNQNKKNMYNCTC